MATTTPHSLQLAAKPICMSRPVLGAGPFWRLSGGALHWAGIAQSKIHRHSFVEGETSTWDGPRDCSAIVATSNDKSFLVTAGLGIYKFTPESAQFDLVLELDKEVAGNRCNDAKSGAIFRYHLDKNSQRIFERQVSHQRALADGFEDSSAIDSKGCTWNARWDGTCVLRLSPQGQVLNRLEWPVMRLTSCAFGGPK